MAEIIDHYYYIFAFKEPVKLPNMNVTDDIIIQTKSNGTVSTVEVQAYGTIEKAREIAQIKTQTVSVNIFTLRSRY